MSGGTHAATILRRHAPSGASALALCVLAAGVVRAESAKVVVHQPDRHTFTVSILPFKNQTRNEAAPAIVSAALESALAATGRFRVLHPRVIVARRTDARVTGYKVENAEPGGDPTTDNAGVDVKLKPSTTERRRVVRLDLVDFEVSGSVTQEGERAHVVARLKYLPTGRLLATADAYGEGDAPIMEAAARAGKALAAAARKGTRQERTDQVLVEYHSGVRTLDGAEKALLRLALADSDNLGAQAALLALYKDAEGGDGQIVRLGASLLRRLEDVSPQDLMVFERLAIDPFETVASAQIRGKQYADAVRTLATALRVYPLHPADKRVLMARAHLGAGQYDEAERTLQRVLKRRPGHGRALYLMGQLAWITLDNIDGPERKLHNWKRQFMSKEKDRKELRQCRALLNRALRLAKTPVQKQRIETFAKTFRVTESLFEFASPSLKVSTLGCKHNQVFLKTRLFALKFGLPSIECRQPCI